MYRISFVAFIGISVSAVPAFAQDAARDLPFDVTRGALVSLDTTLIQWTELRLHVGGVEGELFYRPIDVTAEECRAAALLGMVRLRNLYRQRNGKLPVVLRMGLLCGRAFRGALDYDGLNTRLRILDIESGDIVYEGREAGLPLSG